eukprot:CAMPEP_0181095884 /NCGR_PEP_ID=MMETSP1071-20121207/10744_1 /TAXON_ID=35127 /ORGANISM="Thalassiosira sp., Strain NH16" /LENGTH=325 /DNA_ID=CAMNT_0023178269 /DNA_START=63 /DNA_END=1043 /DNA_ORIENTATION=+
MSLRGRKFFDALQHHPASLFNSSRFRLPCPPYQNSDYWDRLYKDMSSDDVHEWGGFDLQSGLLQFRHETLLHHYDGPKKNDHHQGEVKKSTFQDCMGVSRLSTPEEAIKRYEDHQSDDTDESILLLGSGNSKIGEQILINSFVGPVVQIDISSKVIHLMTQRYQKYLAEASVKRMEFIVDDANGLTALSPDSIGGGVVDKGLIDVLHLSGAMMSMDDNDISENLDGANNPIPRIIDSVHRVLQPSRPFVFFSRSGPEYILRRAFGTVHLDWDEEIRKKWMDIQVLKLLDLDMLLYRFVKADPAETETETTRVTTRGYRKKKKRKS